MHGGPFLANPEFAAPIVASADRRGQPDGVGGAGAASHGGTARPATIGPCEQDRPTACQED
ncbi:hypothetical protein GCM10009714_14840 [Microlunatus capsulatus]